MAGISPVHAQERPVVTLAAPQTLIDTGLLTYMLPRFTLKHRIRVAVVPETEIAPLALIANTGGKPLFEGAGTVWHLALSGVQNDDHTTLVNWLTSDIGLNTVEAFAGQEGLRFTRAAEVVQVAEALDLTGDAANGLMVSNLHCKRCHVVGEADRMSGIGSTPSFFVLRAFPDWDERFYAFYALNPHPSFTRILDLDTTLDPQRKAAIVPLDLSLEELDDIVTYVAGLTPADLGAPIQLQ
jgi:hypothetical protein